LTQKSKDTTKKVQPPRSVEIQAARWDIYDSQQRKQVTEDEKLNTAFKKEIKDMLEEKLKQPGCMIDAEGLAEKATPEEIYSA